MKITQMVTEICGAATSRTITIIEMPDQPPVETITCELCVDTSAVEAALAELASKLKK